MHYEHLGPFSDWPDAARRQGDLYPLAEPGGETRREVRQALAFHGPEEPVDARVERTWSDDGVLGEQVSWSAGFGPRARGWLLRPAAASGPLPGVVALHSHDGYKWYGKEKVADGPEGPLPALAALRAQSYGGRAFANELARRGFAVLAHDVFLWGSRRFPLEAMPESVLQRAQDYVTARAAEGRIVDEIERYNVAASHHEHVVAKYSTLLGGTLAGMVAFEDRVAVSYLRSRPEVDGERIGCAGLSGGGCRAAMLQATCEAIRASVVVGMMSTYEGLLNRHVQSHTWMFSPPGLARHADWPDLAACRAPAPLLVQYLRGDGLFSVEGMEAAHERIAGHYEGARRPDAYTGEFYEGPHRFDREMQGAAFEWLERHL